MIRKLVGHPMTWLFDRCTVQLEILISGVYMLEIKNTRDGYNVK